MDNHFLIKIDKFKIMIGLLIVPLIRPEGLKNINPVMFNFFFKYCTYLSIFIVFCICLKKLIEKSYSISLITAFVIFLFASDLLITISKGGDTVGLVKLYFTSIALVLLIQMYKERINDILDVISKWLAFLMIINLIYMVLFPNGVYKSSSVEGYTTNWFLGYKSSFQYYIFPALVIACLNIAQNSKKITNYFIISLALVETIMSSNKMLLVGVTIILLVFSFRLYEHYSVFNMITYLLFGVFLNLFFLLNNTSSKGIISYIIRTVLKKNLAKGRGKIWSVTFREIAKSPLIGNGYQPSAVRYAMYGRVNHSHNQILEFLYQGGVFLLLIYLIILVIATYYLYINRRNKSAQIVSLAVFAILLMTSVEIFTLNSGVLYWMMLVLAGETDCVSRVRQEDTDNCSMVRS